MPHLVVPAATGAFAGMISDAATPNYGWVTLNAVFAAVGWFVVSRYNIIVGFSGRIGVTVFVTGNLAVLITVAAGELEWSDYIRDGRWQTLTVSHISTYKKSP